MNIHYLIWFAMLGFAALAQLILLIAQINAQRHHPHRSILLIIIASVLGIAYAGLTMLLYTGYFDEPTLLIILLASMLMFVLGTITGVIGSILLLRQYRRLATAAAGNAPDAGRAQPR